METDYKKELRPKSAISFKDNYKSHNDTVFQDHIKTFKAAYNFNEKTLFDGANKAEKEAKKLFKLNSEKLKLCVSQRSSYDHLMDRSINASRALSNKIGTVISRNNDSQFSDKTFVMQPYVARPFSSKSKLGSSLNDSLGKHSEIQLTDSMLSIDQQGKKYCDFKSLSLPTEEECTEEVPGFKVFENLFPVSDDQNSNYRWPVTVTQLPTPGKIKETDIARYIKKIELMHEVKSNSKRNIAKLTNNGTQVRSSSCNLMETSSFAGQVAPWKTDPILLLRYGSNSVHTAIRNNGKISNKFSSLYQKQNDSDNYKENTYITSEPGLIEAPGEVFAKEYMKRYGIEYTSEIETALKTVHDEVKEEIALGKDEENLGYNSVINNRKKEGKSILDYNKKYSSLSKTLKLNKTSEWSLSSTPSTTENYNNKRSFSVIERNNQDDLSELLKYVPLEKNSNYVLSDLTSIINTLATSNTNTAETTQQNILNNYKMNTSLQTTGLIDEKSYLESHSLTRSVSGSSLYNIKALSFPSSIIRNNTPKSISLEPDDKNNIRLNRENIEELKEECEVFENDKLSDVEIEKDINNIIPITKQLRKPSLTNANELLKGVINPSLEFNSLSTDILNPCNSIPTRIIPPTKKMQKTVRKLNTIVQQMVIANAMIKKSINFQKLKEKIKQDGMEKTDANIELIKLVTQNAQSHAEIKRFLNGFEGLPEMK